MSREPRWLDAQEQHVWRSWLQVNRDLTATLQRELQDEAGLSNPDFEVLVHLTDDAEGRVRVSDLAGLLRWERSRISHHAKRMEGRGLVQRVECREDGRGAFIAITPAGREAIEHAAPGHVDGVRRLLFDVLDEGDLACLGQVLDKLLSGQQPAPDATT